MSTISTTNSNSGLGYLLPPAPFFVIGFIYYWLTPVLAIHYFTNIIHISLAVDIWIKPSQYNWAYLLDGLIVIVCWLFGDWLGRIFKRPGTSRFDRIAFDSNYANFYFILMLGLAVLFTVVAIASGANFFTGYEDYNILVLGPYATLAFTTILFKNYFQDHKAKVGFILVFVFSAVMLIGLGSRMLVLLSIIAIFFDYVYTHKLTIKKLVILLTGIVATVFLMLYVGVSRDGGQISFETLLGVLLAEPTFTSIGFVNYLEIVQGRPVTAVPKDLLVSVLNFIPSLLFPGKIILVDQLMHNYGHNPFGANMLLFNLYANFGYFYPFFVVAMGFYFASLYKMAATSVTYRAIYLSSLPALIFYIQREGFVTVLKLLFFNSLALPLAILLLTYALSFVTRAPARR